MAQPAATTTTSANASETPIVSLAHVTLAYGDLRALDNVSLDVRQGERLCVLGANGSGKSTLASVICGLLAPDAGEVTLVGEKVFEAGSADFDAYRRARRKLGLVFQNPEDQIVTSVVEEDVAFGPENLGLPPERIEHLVRRELHRVAMERYAKADPARLSGGQRQRVTIAGALAMEPRVLVLDEPSSSLDVRGRRSVMKVVEKLRGVGCTVVHVTHFMDEALGADRVVVLDHGHVALAGTPQEVFSHVEEVRGLGLEEPFAGQLSSQLRERGLDVSWTCDEGALLADLARRTSGHRAGRVAAAPGDAPHGGGAPVVRAEDVRFSYEQSRRRRRADAAPAALDGVTIDVPHGAHVALVGQTGSGKSTLLRLIAALEVPDQGRIEVDGIPTADRRDRRRLHGRVGYVMQRPERQLFAETVAQDVAYGPSNLGLSPSEVDQRVRRALDLVGLVGKDDASPFQLSGGQQRLCALAGILAMEPNLLVLDEPTAGLDPRGRRKLRRILDGLNADGTTLVEVTHAMEDAARADLVAVLDGGRVVLTDTPAQVFSTDNAEKLHDMGLGIPHPLAFARVLEDAGYPPLGDPLTNETLADAIVRAAGAADRPSAPSAAGTSATADGRDE
ncbi:ABC transporter ATP-binding protein [Tractidigestivibacter scatoligenes]|uniref:ABC transporter ATP-binding protein n=1 Tax=Tractidigestivibacter scatoligenes TaxID=1299998 RepID=UPI0008A9682D|nr:energy-coupling factor transporter ATPase [Tractidigestivibacter scatoligenes]